MFRLLLILVNVHGIKGTTTEIYLFSIKKCHSRDVAKPAAAGDLWFTSAAERD
jgi:hypothetical protein